MRIHSIPRRDSISSEQKGKLWDPYAILEIINPDTKSFTCVGYAASRGRRCQNPIAQRNRTYVYNTIDALALKPPNSSAVASQLPEIAGRALCRAVHQYQVHSIVEQWQEAIQSI